jgi:hypothetical protein
MTKTRDKYITALCVFAIVVGIATRVVRIVATKTIQQDESWTYLNATGHLGEYMDSILDGKNYPVGAWTSASEWKRLIQIEDKLVFDQIQADISRIDIHPPFYFWVVHTWSLLFGTSVQAGMSLNIFIDLLILLALLSFASQNLRNSQEALVVTVVWILCPVSIDSSSWIRHYELFTLFSVLFTYLAFVIFYAPKNLRIRPLQISLLIMVTVAGLLTHFYFTVVVSIGVLLVGLKSVFTKDRIQLVVLFTSLGIATILFVLINPEFYKPFLLYDPNSLRADWVSDLTYRLYRTIRINIFLLAPLFLIVFLIVLEDIYTSKITGIGKFWKQLSSIIKNSLKQPSATYVWGYSILIISFLNLLYLTGVSPQHTMASRYVSLVTPFVAFLPVFFLRLSHLKTLVTVLFCTGMIVLGTTTGIYPAIRTYVGIDPTTINPPKSGVVVIDNLAPGVVLTVNYSLNDGQEVFISDQEHLINNSQSWLPRLSEEGGLYVSTGGSFFGGTYQAREKILGLIGSNNQVVPEKGMPWELVKDWGNLVKTYRVIPQGQ